MFRFAIALLIMSSAILLAIVLQPKALSNFKKNKVFMRFFIVEFLVSFSYVIYNYIK